MGRTALLKDISCADIAFNSPLITALMMAFFKQDVVQM
jgi:hypothetical protein